MLHRELLIHGVFLGGVCDQGIGKQLVRSPWNGSVVGTVAEAGWAEADAALDSARRAFESSRASSPEERQGLLRRVARQVRDRKEELAELLVLEIAKPISMARAEVDRTAMTFDLAADLLDSPQRLKVPLDFDPRGRDYQAWFERKPMGVVLAIVPYNWPFNLSAHKVAPALAAGNAVVLKASPQASLATLSLARLIHEAGCPPGLLNALNCDASVSERLTKDRRVDMVSFTGSAAVGWRIKELCWDKPVALELGGNASAIVFAGADPAWAAQRLCTSAYGFAGQVCISAQHAWAHCSVYDEFKKQLIASSLGCSHGDPSREETVCGPLISESAAQRVASWIQEARDAGCTVLVGGEVEGSRLTPTLVEAPPVESAPHPAWSTRLMTEEVFGPVLTVGCFEDIGHLIERINASPYGIHASLFGAEEEQVSRCFQDLDVGGVVVDDFPTLRFDNMPYGGNKRSGFGREGVRYAFEEMTRPRSLVRRRSPDGR